MKSPLVRFTCGCIGIPLSVPREHVEGTEKVWLFTACDREDDTISGSIREMEAKKILGGTPLTEEEFLGLQGRLSLQLSAGATMFVIAAQLQSGYSALSQWRKAPSV